MTARATPGPAAKAAIVKKRASPGPGAPSKVRAFLAAQGEPMTAGEIAAALGVGDIRRIANSLYFLHRRDEARFVHDRRMIPSGRGGVAARRVKVWRIAERAPGGAKGDRSRTRSDVKPAPFGAGPHAGAPA